MTESELQRQGLASWHFHLDNPTILGWSVVAVYVIAALTCAAAAMRGGSLDPEAGRRDRSAGIWWAFAFGLAFLGVNKQLDLQTLLIVIGRHLSAAGGWWDRRRKVQLVFSLVFGVGIGLLLIWLAARNRDFFMKNPHVFWGVIVLAVFVALRAASINHANEYLRVDLRDENWSWVLEISGSVLIGIGALRQAGNKCLK
jgi:hypothetical protein